MPEEALRRISDLELPSPTSTRSSRSLESLRSGLWNRHMESFKSNKLNKSHIPRCEFCGSTMEIQGGSPVCSGDSGKHCTVKKGLSRYDIAKRRAKE